MDIPQSFKQFVSEETTAEGIREDLSARALKKAADIARAQANAELQKAQLVLGPAGLVRKLAEVQLLIDRIPKRGHNQHFGYDFATESDITQAIRKELAARAIMIVPDIKAVTYREANTKNGIQTIARVDIKFTLHDGESGASLSFHGAGEGGDSGDKCIPKAITSALKYALLKLFLIPTGDDPEIDKSKAAVGKRTRGAEPSKDTPGPSVADSAQSYTHTPRYPGGTDRPLTAAAVASPIPIPPNVNPYTGEEHEPCPEGAYRVLKYEKDRYGWHRGWLVSNRITADHAIEVKTKYDTGLMLEAAAQAGKPVTATFNEKGYLAKLDWWVDKINGQQEEEPPFNESSTPF